MKNGIVLLMMLNLLFIGQGVSAQTAANLNKKEVSEIQYIMEEEKLARDVYLVLDEKWNSIIFSHKSNSEQRHYDKMKELAYQYKLSIPVPVQKDEKGKFENKKLQDAYDEMVEEGKVSLENALRIGAKIEEMDIADLNVAMRENKNENILKVYGQLKHASEKHLNSFNQNLAKEGIIYEPVILSQKDFEAIVNAKASCERRGEEGKGCCSSKRTKSAKAEKSCNGKKGKGKKEKACCNSSK